MSFYVSVGSLALGIPWRSFGDPLGAFFAGLCDSFGVPWIPQSAFVGPKGALWALLGGRVGSWVALEAASGKIWEILGPILR